MVLLGISNSIKSCKLTFNKEKNKEKKDILVSQELRG
jgi:hypothetical protein